MEAEIPLNFTRPFLHKTPTSRELVYMGNFPQTKRAATYVKNFTPSQPKKHSNNAVHAHPQGINSIAVKPEQPKSHKKHYFLKNLNINKQQTINIYSKNLNIAIKYNSCSPPVRLTRIINHLSSNSGRNIVVHGCHTRKLNTGAFEYRGIASTYT